MSDGMLYSVFLIVLRLLSRGYPALFLEVWFFFWGESAYEVFLLGVDGFLG
jgi:hypothetical protein